MTGPAEEARTRQGLYRLTGATLRPPEAGTLAVLAAAVEFMETRDLGRFSFALHWRSLAARIADPPMLTSLQPEYVRLFGVGISGTPATPTESSYRMPKQEGGVGDFVARLEEEYRRMGLTSAGSAEPPDHIATELDAMSFLVGTEAKALSAGLVDDATQALASQRVFLDRHLSVWVPLFAAKARAAGPSPFYAAVIDFLHSFIVHEKAITSVLLTHMETA